MDIGLPILGLVVFILIISFRKLKLIKKSKPLLFWGVIILTSFIFVFGCEEFYRRAIGRWAGSYVFAECWALDINESNLIEIINELKTEDPSLQPPNQNKLTYGRHSGYDESSPWIQIYRADLKKDATTKPPKHTDYNSYGDSTNNWTDYYYYIDFYYPDTKEIVHTWTRPYLDSSITNFAFVSISTTDTTNFRFINHDFWYLANKREISKFENNILNRIREKIEKRKKSGA